MSDSENDSNDNDVDQSALTNQHYSIETAEAWLRKNVRVAHGKFLPSKAVRERFGTDKMNNMYHAMRRVYGQHVRRRRMKDKRGWIHAMVEQPVVFVIIYCSLLMTRTGQKM